MRRVSGVPATDVAVAALILNAPSSTTIEPASMLMIDWVSWRGR